jgi:hypothetical protein
LSRNEVPLHASTYEFIPTDGERESVLVSVVGNEASSGMFEQVYAPYGFLPYQPNQEDEQINYVLDSYCRKIQTTISQSEQHRILT